MPVPLCLMWPLQAGRQGKVPGRLARCQAGRASCQAGRHDKVQQRHRRFTHGGRLPKAAGPTLKPLAGGHGRAGDSHHHQAV